MKPPADAPAGTGTTGAAADPGDNPGRGGRADPDDPPGVPATATSRVPAPRTGPEPVPASRTGPEPMPASRTGPASESTVAEATEFSMAESEGAEAPATATSGPGRANGELTDRERDILAFERQWWKHAGAKEQAIRDAFDLSATRYYQLLNGLLDNPAALAAEPVLIARLRRIRSSRARSRRR